MNAPRETSCSPSPFNSAALYPPTMSFGFGHQRYSPKPDDGDTIRLQPESLVSGQPWQGRCGNCVRLFRVTFELGIERLLRRPPGYPKDAFSRPPIVSTVRRA